MAESLDQAVARALGVEIEALKDRRDSAVSQKRVLQDQKANLQAQLAAINVQLVTCNADIDEATALIDGMKIEADTRKAKP